MRTRFAPSPTGPLHLGHAFSALTAFDMAQAAQGQFLLRIENIDQTRSRPSYEDAIFDDLRWLGMSWPEPVLRQSTRLPVYRAALADLWARGLLYPCTCTRADIRAALSAPQEGAPGPDGPVYPGTCRTRVRSGALPEGAVLRLDMAKATEGLGALTYRETGLGAGEKTVFPDQLRTKVGDVVLARHGMGTSYHLSVVLDDADQGITHVVRGADLQDATQIHVLLKELLSLPRPVYHHHKLIRDAEGKRLAKRNDARAIARYRAEGATPAQIRAHLGL